MRQPADGWLERRSVELHCLDWSPDSPPGLGPAILLLHGLSSNARFWDRMARLMPNRRLVALDQRGHGLTGRGSHAPEYPSGFAMQELLDDVAFVIEALGLGRPVVVGHSWGATVALEFAARPDGASGLVFIDGPVQSAANLFSWEEAQQFMQPPLPRFTSFEAALAASEHDFEGTWSDDLKPFVEARVIPDGDGLILTLSGPVRYELLRGLYESKPELLWPQVEVPASVLLAKQSFARTSTFKQAGVKQLKRIAPQVEVIWFDAPHDIPLHMPGEIAAAVERIAGLAANRVESETSAG